MTDTYGSITIGPTFVRVEAEPQVKTRLRRVFARMDQRAGDELLISNTPEHCRDLLWFMDRYPLAIADKDLEILQAGSDAFQVREQRMSDLLAGRLPVEAIELRKPPRDYQVQAMQACEIRGGLLLADELGTGKTVSGLLPISKPEYVPAIFVAENHLVRQMEEKANEFLVDRVVHRIRKGTPYDLLAHKPRLDLRADRLPDVCVISYHMLRGWAETFGTFARYTVFDEVQRLRSNSSLIYSAAKHLASKCVMSMGLSATPIYNYGSEFFWVINALLPGVLGTRAEFVREWCDGGGDKAMLIDADDFGAYLRREGILMRRTRADVNRELPEGDALRIPQHVDADEKVIDKIEGNAVELARVILAKNESRRGARMQASGELDTIMRQATGIAKAPYVSEFVRLLIESGEKVIVFGWHREVYRIWQERLAEYNPVLFTGSESAARKAKSVEQFTGMNTSTYFPESQVMLMSLRAGAGVDGLQEYCNVVAFGELDWSDGVHQQCIGRVERDGQLEKALAYFLVADHGSDPIVAQVCGIKFEQREAVINPGGPLVQRVDIGEDHIKRIAEELLAKASKRRR